MVENKPTLGYWKIRGLGAQIRYLLTHCGVDFEDKVYDVSKNEDGSWDRSDWTNAKPNMGMPFPNLPYYIDGDLKLSETNAIMKHICRKHKPELLGTTLEEQANMDMMEGIVGGLKGAATMPCYMGTPREDIIKDLTPKA
jgi:glutathione S-transferase